MVFRVSDGRIKRKAMVVRFAAIDTFAGVLVAAADFEWTCRRCILALGKSPSAEIKFELFDKKEYGLKLKKGWEQQVRQKGKGIKKFEDIFDVWARDTQLRYVLWADIEYAMSCRNRLIHGIDGGIGDSDGLQCVNILQCANDILEAYLGQYGLSVYQRISRQKGGWSDAAKQAKAKKTFAMLADIRNGKDLKTRREKKRDEVIIDGIRMLKSNLRSRFGVSAAHCAEIVKCIK